MRYKNIIPLFIFFCVSIAIKGQNAPYTIYLEKINASLPAVHSNAIAQYQNYWLIIGGRTNGLHGMSTNDGFPGEYINNEIIVIDTTNWSYQSISLNKLPDSVAAPLRSTNMLFLQEDSILYMAGGFGYDSTLNTYITFPVLTKFNIPNTIQAVINNFSLRNSFVQLKNNFFSMCGGEMLKLNNYYFLCFGHDFRGRYAEFAIPIFTQTYANAIKPFQINNNGNNLNYTELNPLNDTANYHRRDLNVSNFIMPDGNQCLMTFGGVFQYDKNLPYLNPIKISASPTISADTLSYQQKYSHYTCANFGIYDGLSQKTTQVFLGGISLNDYNFNTQQAELDTLVPFINKINQMTFSSDGNIQEQINDYELPGLLGSNASFLVNKNLNVINNDKILNGNLIGNNYVLGGYFYGGIKASGPNLMPSIANPDIYRVSIKKSITNLTNQSDQSSIKIYPNPSNGNISIIFPAKYNGSVFQLEVYTIDGKLFNHYEFDTSSSNKYLSTGLAPGSYIIKIKNQEKSLISVNKLIVN